MAFIFWLLRAVKVLYNIFLYYEIRSFYATALKISAVSLYYVKFAKLFFVVNSHGNLSAYKTNHITASSIYFIVELISIIK